MIDPVSNSGGTPISLRDYAKARGVSPMAVSKAIKSGRLVRSVVRDHRGQPKIGDVALADREWAAGTDLSKAPGYVKERETARPPPPRAPRAEAPRAPPPRAPADAPAGDDDDGGGPPEDVSLVEQTAREKFWKANLAELDYRKRSGELVEAKDVEAQLSDLFANCRNKLLGVPSRARQQDPVLTRDQILLVEGLIREALEELASAAGADEEPEPQAAGAVQ